MTKEKPLIHNKRRNHIRLHSEGTTTLLVCGLLFVAVLVLIYYFCGPCVGFWLPLTILGAVYCILLNFFRCPVRMFQGPTTQTVVAPCDGHVVVVEEVDETEYFNDRRLMVSIFMSITNVHANWFPCDGRVVKVAHQKGNFKAAYLPKASTENERSMIVVETPHGQFVMARQIAGAMARRIVTYAEEGQECFIDEHMGFIKFGSRVDVYLPLGTEVKVKVGQRTVGDETVLACLRPEG